MSEQGNIDKENGIQKTFRAVWESKSDPAGRWLYHDSCQMTSENEPFYHFVIKHFNSDFGVSEHVRHPRQCLDKDASRERQ